MSGFEVVGIILGAYPLLMTVLEVYSETRSGKGARRLVRSLNIEAAIFDNFIHHLLAPPIISEAELIRLTDPTCPDLDLWKDVGLETKLNARLGPVIASIVVDILPEINELLRLLRNELTLSDHGMVRNSLRIESSPFHPANVAAINRLSYVDFAQTFELRSTLYRTLPSKSISSS